MFEKVLKVVPDFSEVQFSNSAIIRYSQLFEMNKTITVFCNRGTSGIDGSTSTAIGAAFMSKKRTTFISGDLSFFYDSNALWNDYIPTNFRIIIIKTPGPFNETNCITIWLYIPVISRLCTLQIFFYIGRD